MQPSTSTWPTTFPVHDAYVLRKLRKRQGASWLASRYPNASTEDIDAALSVCLSDADPRAEVIHATPQLRNEFAAASFLLGESLTQLSAVLQVSRGTAHQAIKKRITDEDTAKRRSYRLKIEAVQVLWNAFQSVVRATPTAFDGMTVIQLADFLEASVDLQELGVPQGR